MAKIGMKGQLTPPKKVRDTLGLKPGERGRVCATASGGVYIEKPDTSQRYHERLDALAKRRSIRDITTDQFTEASRGEVPSGSEKRRQQLGGK
jgi:antitoxin PrlF